MQVHIGERAEPWVGRQHVCRESKRQGSEDDAQGAKERGTRGGPTSIDAPHCHLADPTISAR